MGEIQIFIAALLVSVALLNALAHWWQVPYPIVLVLGGLALGLVPGIPEIELDPDLVLLIFLPPLLYSGAFFADLNALRHDTRVISAWSGMRGAVSLAAALALPLTTDAGAPLPGRDLILFITFALILVTIVGQGLTLPILIRWLGVQADGTEEAHEELRARLAAAEAALRCLDRVEAEGWAREDTVERMRGLFRF